MPQANDLPVVGGEINPVGPFVGDGDRPIAEVELGQRGAAPRIQHEETAESIKDGWLRTGDIGFMDEKGWFYLVDRKKDMICRGGENVYCVEVENALAAHPAIFEVAVIGVPDEVMGEKVGAVIVLRPGQQPDPADILAFARKHLADFKVPQYLAIRAEPLPRNPGGKMLKPVLRKAVEWGKPLR